VQGRFSRPAASGWPGRDCIACAIGYGRQLGQAATFYSTLGAAGSILAGQAWANRHGRLGSREAFKHTCRALGQTGSRRRHKHAVESGLDGISVAIYLPALLPTFLAWIRYKTLPRQADRFRSAMVDGSLVGQVRYRALLSHKIPDSHQASERPQVGSRPNRRMLGLCRIAPVSGSCLPQGQAGATSA
jgi:hypothetical protein